MSQSTSKKDTKDVSAKDTRRVSIAPEFAEDKGGGVSTMENTSSHQVSAVSSESKVKRKKSGFTDGKRARSVSVKLPTCPEGQTVTATGNPCERPPHAKGAKHKRKGGFRVPLKKEDGNMEAQIIEYNCEFPNRVVVRLEYLMQTTKVRLNDKHYMDDFYAKLVEEEKRATLKATRYRERAEQERMKKLIIDGIDKEIPKELSYLYKHPVFRVNQMLSRLNDFDTHMLVKPLDQYEEMTPVEPYEFNGNKFFKHLHETGDLWMPATLQIHEDNKLEGKIHRAKLRLLQKRKLQAAEEKIMRILHNGPFTPKEEEEEYEWVGGEDGEAKLKTKEEEVKPSWLIEFEKDLAKEQIEDAKLSKMLKMTTTTQGFSPRDMAVEKVRAKAQKQVAQLNNRILKSKEKQKEQDAQLEMKRHEQEIHYLDTFNYDRARIIANFEKHHKHGTVDDLYNRPDQKSRRSEVSKGDLKPYEEIFAGPTEEQQRRTPKTKFANEPLFTKLQKIHGIGNQHPFHHYENFEDSLMHYFDTAEDGEQMVELGDGITEMYTRELMVADDHLKKRTEMVEKLKGKLKTIGSDNPSPKSELADSNISNTPDLDVSLPDSPGEE